MDKLNNNMYIGLCRSFFTTMVTSNTEWQHKMKQYVMIPKTNIEKALDSDMSNESIVRIIMKRVKFELIRNVSSFIVSTRPGKKIYR